MTFASLLPSGGGLVSGKGLLSIIHFKIGCCALAGGQRLIMPDQQRPT